MTILFRIRDRMSGSGPDQSALSACKSCLVSGIACALLLPCQANAQNAGTQVAQMDVAQMDVAQMDVAQMDVAQVDVAEADLAISARVSRREPQLGGGHATLLELKAIATHGLRLSHSLGVGAAGVVSTATSEGDRAKSSQAARFAMNWHLAGGQSKFDGLFHIDFGHGARWPSKGHGFVLRGGADLKFAGNQQYYFSSFNAPNVDAGYQYVDYRRLVELSLRTSLLWDGRYRFENSPTKNLPTTVGLGPLFELGVAPLWISLQLLRGGGLTQVNANLCSRPGGAWSLCMKLSQISDGWLLDESMHRLTTGIFAVGWAPTSN